MNYVIVLLAVLFAIFIGQTDVVQACVGIQESTVSLWYELQPWLLPLFCLLLPFIVIRNKEKRPSKISKVSVLLYSLSQFAIAAVFLLILGPLLFMVLEKVDPYGDFMLIPVLLLIIMQFFAAYLLSKKLFLISTRKSVYLNIVLMFLVDAFLYFKFMVITLC